MGQALYRKYRSKSLDDIVGQEHITTTLKQALKQGRISHAYLFTGPRGVGKTSIARIWAHEINQIPYDDDSAHLDIIEIDAASNRRIDEIRELRDKVHIAPTSAKYKVYIIDEVHMLTKEAFNALLKTLEEPPAHAVFILATTDAHKLPETIISRTQRYSFKAAEANKVVALLRTIADAENITVSDAALELLAEHGGGSFRDSVSLLDQASSNGSTIELESAQQLLGVPSSEAVNTLLQAVLQSADAKQLISQLNDLYEQGFQAPAIAKQLARAIRTGLTEQTAAFDHHAAFGLLEALIEVPVSHNPERYLEISLLKARPHTATAAAVLPVKIEQPTKTIAPEAVVAETPPEPKVTPQAEATVEPEPETEPEPVVDTDSEAVIEAPTDSVVTASVLDAASWPLVLQVLKKRHNTLYGVIRMAQPTFNASNVTLAFAFAFHQKRITEPANRKIVIDIIQEVTGQVVTVECLLDKGANPSNPPIPSSSAPAAKDISAISNIFGGAELLES